MPEHLLLAAETVLCAAAVAAVIFAWILDIRSSWPEIKEWTVWDRFRFKKKRKAKDGQGDS